MGQWVDFLSWSWLRRTYHLPSSKPLPHVAINLDFLNVLLHDGNGQLRVKSSDKCVINRRIANEMEIDAGCGSETRRGMMQLTCPADDLGINGKCSASSSVRERDCRVAH